MTDPYNPGPEGWQEHEGDVWIWETNDFDLQVQPADDHDGWVYMVRTTPDSTISGNVRTDEGDVTDAMEIAEAVLENEFGFNAQDWISEGPPADHTNNPPYTPRNDQERYDPEVRMYQNMTSKEPQVDYAVGYKQGFTDAIREVTASQDLVDLEQAMRNALDDGFNRDDIEMFRAGVNAAETEGHNVSEAYALLEQIEDHAIDAGMLDDEYDDDDAWDEDDPSHRPDY